MNTTRKSFLILFSITSFVISAQAQRGSDFRGQRSSNSDRNGGSYSNRNSGDFSRQQRSVDRSTDISRQGNNSPIERRTINDRITNQNPVRQDNPGFRRNEVSPAGNDRNFNRDVVLGNQRNADSRPVTQNNSVFRRNDISPVTSDRNPRISNDRNLSRNLVLGNQRQADFNSQRNSRTVIINNYSNYNRYPGVYNYGPGGYSFARYNYYVPRRYEYYGAPRYNVMPRTFISITFGGYPYWYDGGIFYGYYGGYYEPVFAPRGIHISILPVGYYPIYVGPDPYYYYEGVYYRRLQDRNDEYEVVDAPMGAVVKSLPKGATKVVLNGEKFYEFDGTYYTEGTNNKNEVVYTVVGKNGVINNSDQPAVTNTPQAPQIGDEITTLPENSKQVTINGEVLYVTPDHLYLKAENINNTTTYKVVGKAE